MFDPSPDRESFWSERRWERWAPIAGILAVLLWVIGIVIVESDQPDDEASLEALAAFFEDEAGRLLAGGFLFMLGSALFVYFLGSLRTRFWAAEGSAGRLTTIMFGTGVAAAIFIAATQAPSVAGAITAEETERALDGGAAQVFAELGDGFFVAAETMLVVFFFASALAILRTRAFPAWLGWVTFVFAVLAVLPWIGWATVVWGLPLWVLVLSIWMIARGAEPRRATGPNATRHRIDSAAVKGVVLAGGTGTRLHPLTRITNKHLLPIYDRPMVTYAIEALVQAGITDLMVVTGGTHAGEFLRLLGNGHEWGIDRLEYAYQEEAGGIAQALGLAERFVGGERVVVMLADNVVERSIRSAAENFGEQEGGARILLAREEDDAHLRHLGVPELDGDGRVLRILEKPEQPPSPFAVTGIYFYDPDVFEVVSHLEPSARGELEITDVNNWYVDQGRMEYDVLEGFWGDAGESIDAYYAVNDFVRANGANRP